MEINKMTERHALKFAALGVAQQQRIMKALAKKARVYAQNKENNNAEKKEAAAASAKQYDWQRRVRLAREARAIHLVRAFLKGTPYAKVENSLKFHTMNPLLVTQEHMPFSVSTMSPNFTREFSNWLAA